jgi:hypothetical protein
MAYVSKNNNQLPDATISCCARFPENSCVLIILHNTKRYACQAKEFIQRIKGDDREKNNKGILWFSVAVLSALSVTALWGLPAAAQQTASQPQVLSNAVMKESIHSDVSPPLATLLTEASIAQGARALHKPMKPKLLQLRGAQQSQSEVASGAI